MIKFGERTVNRRFFIHWLSLNRLDINSQLHPEKMKFTFILLLIFSACNLQGQTIEGVVLDSENQLPLVNVNIFFPKDNTGTTSNQQGKFALKVKTSIEANDTLSFSFVGYDSENITFSRLQKNYFVVTLTPKVESISEVEVRSNRVLKPTIEYQELSPMKTGVFAFGTGLIDGKIYVIGGDASFIEDSGRKALEEVSADPDSKMQDLIMEAGLNVTWEHYTGQLQVFDIDSNRWIYPEVAFQERAYHNIVCANEMLYVLGGKHLTVNRRLEYLVNDIEVYDPVQQTIVVDETNPHHAANAFSFCYQGNIIVMGGSVKLNPDESKVFTSKMHLFNLKTGMWYELKDMPTAKETKGVLNDFTLYLVGGFDNTPLKDIESYNLVTGEWQKEGELFSPIERPGLASDGDKIFIFDDDRIMTFDTFTKVLSEYAIDLDLFSPELHCYDGKLFMVGGYTEADYIKKASNKVYSIDLKAFSNTRKLRSFKY
ncbi:Kelch repeat-containing protein [Marinilabilia sp.]